jgi:hypothetical protein
MVKYQKIIVVYESMQNRDNRNDKSSKKKKQTTTINDNISDDNAKKWLIVHLSKDIPFNEVLVSLNISIRVYRFKTETKHYSVANSLIEKELLLEGEFMTMIILDPYWFLRIIQLIVRQLWWTSIVIFPSLAMLMSCHRRALQNAFMCLIFLDTSTP